MKKIDFKFSQWIFYVKYVLLVFLLFFIAAAGTVLPDILR